MKSVVKNEIVVPESQVIEIDLLADVPTGPAEMGSPREPCPIGMDVGKGQIAEDFDAPLPEDLLELFEGQL